MHPNTPINGPADPVGWKAAEWAKRPHLRWFLESEPWQAEQLSQVCRKTAICVPSGQVYGAQYTTTQHP